MEYSIIICKGCGCKFRIHSYQVYNGDPRYCPKCNRESANEKETEN